MFARAKTSRGMEYLQIVENYRERGPGGRVRQRLVMYVGHYDSLDEALRFMPRELTQARRRATMAEKRATGIARAPLVGLNARWTEEAEAEARALRGEANRLAEKLDALRRLVADNPDLLERDRARASRRAERDKKRIQRLQEQRALLVTTDRGLAG